MLVFLEITGLNMIPRVSLMKNGEEIVSVGGAMEPSAKNMGISASNSVLLDLARVCKSVSDILEIIISYNPP